MSTPLNRVTATIAGGFMLSVLATSIPTIATAAPPPKTVEGTVTNWSDSTSSFQTKATVDMWTFSYDRDKLQKIGTPKVGARIKITYHMNGSSYVADKVVVEKNPK